MSAASSPVWHDDCERHRLRGAAELNDDVDQRLGRFWIRAITDGSSSPLRFVLCSMGDSPHSTVRHALQGKGEHEGSPAPCNRRGKIVAAVVASRTARASAGRNSRWSAEASAGPIMANIGRCHLRGRFATARGDAPGVWACWGVLGGDGRLRGVRRLQRLPRPQ